MAAKIQVWCKHKKYYMILTAQNEHCLDYVMLYINKWMKIRQRALCYGLLLFRALPKSGISMPPKPSQGDIFGQFVEAHGPNMTKESTVQNALNLEQVNS